MTKLIKSRVGGRGVQPRKSRRARGPRNLQSRIRSGHHCMEIAPRGIKKKSRRRSTWSKGSILGGYHAGPIRLGGQCAGKGLVDH